MQIKCPTKNELAAFADGSLDDSGSAVVAQHIDSCANCGAALETLDVAEGTIVSLLRSPAIEDEFASEDSCRSVLKQVRQLDELLTLDEHVGLEEVQRVPERLGQYRLVTKLGQGGMGEVYEATHTSLHRTVALKLLHSGRFKDASAVERFRREMKAIGQLDHPNIVRATDAGVIDGQHYLVMELVDGINLSQLLRKQGTLRCADACELIRQAAMGLQHAHDRGFVHRDVKPSNLIVTISSVSPTHAYSAASDLDTSPKVALVKVLDMGLALFDDRHVLEEQDLTSVGQLLGTLDYMSPEQYDDTRCVDARSDVYSLGATLYKLLCGKAPLADYKSTTEKTRALATAEIPRITERNTDVPAELASIVHRMLDPDPTKRFATVADVAKALEPLCHDSDLPALMMSTTSLEADRAIDAVRSEIKKRSMPVLLGWCLVLGASICLLILGAFLIRIKHNDGTESIIQLDSDSVESITIEPHGEPTPRPRVELKPEAVDLTDGALRFDGNRYVEIPSLKYDGSHPITMEAWVTPDKLRNSVPFVNVLTLKGAATIRLGSDGRWMAVVPRDAEAGSLDGAKSDAPARFGITTHIALVWDGTEVHLYVGGKQQAELIDDLRLPSNQSLRIGGHVTDDGTGYTHLFHGIIDEVRISKVARYQNDFTPKMHFEPDPDTTGLYPFDDHADETVSDSSDNGHHGTIVGVSWIKFDSPPQASGDK